MSNSNLIATSRVDAAVGGPDARPTHVALVDEFPSSMPRAADTVVLLKPLRDGELFEIRWFDGNAELKSCDYGTMAASHWLFATGRAVGEQLEFRSRGGKWWAQRGAERIALCPPPKDPRANPVFIEGTARIVDEERVSPGAKKEHPTATLLATTMPESCGDGVVLTPIFASPQLPTKVPFFVGSFRIAPGCASDPHSHESAEIWYIASGSGRVLSGGREVLVRRGDFVYLTPQTTHQIENTGDEPIEATSVCWSC